METKEIKLTDVCDFQGGTQPPKEEWINEQRNGYVRMLQIRDFTQGKAEFVEFVRDTKKLNKCKTDDILIGRYGASVGKILTGLEGAYNVAMIKTIPDETRLLKKFLYYVLTGPSFQNFIGRIGARAAQAGFNKEDLSYFKLHLPSLANQERIADILSKSEELIKQRKKSIAYADEFIKSIFLKMFGSLERNERGWKTVRFEKVAKNENSKRVPIKQEDRDYREGIYPYYGATGIIDTIDDYKFDGEYLLVAEDGKNLLFRRKNNAFMANGKFWVNNHAHVLSYNGVANLRYLEFFLNSIDFKPYISGIDQVKLNKENLDRIPVPIPPTELQSQFHSILTKTETLKEYYKISLQELENLFSSIGQRVFRGELNIIEKIVIDGSIKIQPEISADVIAIDKINKELSDYHKSIPDSGAPVNIDNKLKHLDAELQIRGEIPFTENYVKYRLIKEKQTAPFTFEKLWKEITEFPFETVPDYDEFSELLFEWLSEENSFIRQQYNEITKQTELVLNETAKA